MNTIIAAVLAATTVYVSPKGSDSNDGSKRNPVLTAARAVEIVRGVAVDEPKTIVFMDGVYAFSNEVQLVAADRDYVFRAEHKGKARLTGAVKVTGWRTDPADPRFPSPTSRSRRPRPPSTPSSPTGSSPTSPPIRS